MHEDTLLALAALKGSKKLSLTAEKLAVILGELRHSSDAEIQQILWPPKVAPKRAKKPADPLAEHVKKALAKFKATASIKAERLVRYLLPNRDDIPKTMPNALKLLRTYFSDADIAIAADELMAKLAEEGGRSVTFS